MGTGNLARYRQTRQTALMHSRIRPIVISAACLLLIFSCLIMVFLRLRGESSVTPLEVEIRNVADKALAYCSVPVPAGGLRPARFLRSARIGATSSFRTSIMVVVGGSWQKELGVYTPIPRNSENGLEFEYLLPVPTNKVWKIQIARKEGHDWRIGKANWSCPLPFDFKTIVFESQTFTNHPAI